PHRLSRSAGTAMIYSSSPRDGCPPHSADTDTRYTPSGRDPHTRASGHQVIIVASIVARIDAFKAVPVVGKDLFEDAPGRRSGCSHQAASLRSMGLGIVALLYHV